MGKKKSTRKPQVKRKEVLEKEFNCLFCNHEKSITCKMDRENKVGHLICKSCGVSFQTMINHLSAPVDVYADWVDACEGVGKNQSTVGGEYSDQEEGFGNDDFDD